MPFEGEPTKDGLLRFAQDRAAPLLKKRQKRRPPAAPRRGSPPPRADPLATWDAPRTQEESPGCSPPSALPTLESVRACVRAIAYAGVSTADTRLRLSSQRLCGPLRQRQDDAWASAAVPHFRLSTPELPLLTTPACLQSRPAPRTGGCVDRSAWSGAGAPHTCAGLLRRLGGRPRRRDRRCTGGRQNLRARGCSPLFKGCDLVCEAATLCVTCVKGCGPFATRRTAARPLSTTRRSWPRPRRPSRRPPPMQCPSLGPYASSGRAWRPWAAHHSIGRDRAAGCPGTAELSLP